MELIFRWSALSFDSIILSKNSPDLTIASPASNKESGFSSLLLKELV